MIKSNRRAKLASSSFAYRGSNKLFNPAANLPQEIESISPILEENQVESPERFNRRSSLGPEATPMMICSHVMDDEFMVDSLNTQGNTIERITVEQNPGNKENEHLNTIGEESVIEGNFMNALQTAISHFEDSNVGPKEKNKQMTDLSNITTNNSMVEKCEEYALENETLKKQYNTLLAKYNEMKTSNKKLMSDYAILRSQLEESKAVKYFIKNRLRVYMKRR